MAITEIQDPQQVYRLPQSRYIDAVRWLQPLSAFDRFSVLAFHDAQSDSSSLEIHALTTNPSPTLSLQSSWTPPSRISSLRTSQSSRRPILAASTFSGSVHILGCDSVNGAAIQSEASISDPGYHAGPVSSIDLRDDANECVSVGEDGRINLVSIDSRLNYRRVFDGNGLVSYTAVKWASPTEFVTGCNGYGVHWWDLRKPGGPATQFKGNLFQGKTPGIIHSVDVHPSRKHTCLVGGSSGVVFAWDLRNPQHPIILSGVETGWSTNHPVSESEVWEVRYDNYTKSSNISNFSSSKILPVMMCSEDGILASLEQGEEPNELLAEPCAINSFDIDPKNPSDVICSLEWESIVILSRP